MLIEVASVYLQGHPEARASWITRTGFFFSRAGGHAGDRLDLSVMVEEGNIKRYTSLLHPESMIGCLLLIIDEEHASIGSQ